MRVVAPSCKLARRLIALLTHKRGDEGAPHNPLATPAALPTDTRRASRWERSPRRRHFQPTRPKHTN